jgi:hypothetical protein
MSWLDLVARLLRWAEEELALPDPSSIIGAAALAWEVNVGSDHP